MSELIPLFPLSTPLFPGIVLPLEIFEPRYRRLVADLLALPAGSPRQVFGVVAIRQGWEVERVAPAEALYDIGCTARLQAVHPRADGGYRIATVGGDRFRLLEVVVDDDHPYLRGRVGWLAEDEAAEESAAAREGLVEPGGGLRPPGPGRPGAADDVEAAVARGSMELLVRGVRHLFSRYVAEVAALRLGWDVPGGAAAAPAAEAVDEGPEDDEAERVSTRTEQMLREAADDPAALSYLVAAAALLTTEDRQALLAISATRRRLAEESRLLRRELTLLQTLGAVPAPLQEFLIPMTVN